MDATLLTLLVTLLVAGAVTGVLAGLFGVGGGAIMVPVLYQVFLILKVPQDIAMHLSVGTSLAVIIPTSLRSFWGHYKKQAVDMAVVKQWAWPVVGGVTLGAFAAAYAPSAILRAIFAILTFIFGAKMLFAKPHWRISHTLPKPIHLKMYGTGIGFFSSLMGVGGGVMGNMVLTLYNMPLLKAIATCSALGVLISIPGTLGFMWAGFGYTSQTSVAAIGYVSWLGFICIAPISVLFTPLGVKLAHAASKKQLEIAFGLFMWAVALRFGFSFL